MPALTRAKVAAEARCQLLQSQVHKLQAELAAAEAETGLVQESIDTVITSGDVGVLAGLKERLRTSRASSTRRVFKRRPASDAVKPKSRAAKSPQDGAGPAGAGDAPQHAPPDGADAASASHSEGAPEELDDPEVEVRPRPLCLFPSLLSCKHALTARLPSSPPAPLAAAGGPTRGEPHADGPPGFQQGAAGGGGG